MRVTLDQLEAVELAEMCEFLDHWLAADPKAAGSYRSFVGVDDADEDLRTALQHFAALLMVAPPETRP